MADQSCLWYIRNLRFFPQLDEEAMMELAGKSRMMTAKRGDRVSVRTIAAGQAYLVKEGHLRMLREGHDGKVLALDILEPGDIVGIAPILTESGDADMAEAVEDVLFCRVSAAMLRDVLERNPGVALHFSKILGLQRRRMEMRLVDIAFCTVRVRLVRLLLDLAHRFGRETSGGVEIRVKLAHRELADMIGANREAVTRSLNALLDEKVIAFRGKAIVVKDLAELRKRADSDRDWRSLSSDEEP